MSNVTLAAKVAESFGSDVEVYCNPMADGTYRMDAYADSIATVKAFVRLALISISKSGEVSSVETGHDGEQHYVRIAFA